MDEPKIAILGGKGMLGTDVAAECGSRGLKATVLDLPEFDITCHDELHRVLADYDAVINCAAYTNVEKAESEPGLAYKVNAQAVGNLASIVKQTGAWLLHISTDFVFDGKKSLPYVETDTPNPINTYGKSKLAGEELLAKSRCRHCIMRLEWTYGQAGNNFITKLISLAKERKSLRVVDDQIGSPTATGEVAKVICQMLKKKCEGVFHFAANGYVSRYDMARFIFDKRRIDVKLSSCKSTDYKCAAARPLSSRFDCGKIEALLGEKIQNWQQPLECFLRKL